MPSLSAISALPVLAARLSRIRADGIARCNGRNEMVSDQFCSDADQFMRVEWARDG